MKNSKHVVHNLPALPMDDIDKRDCFAAKASQSDWAGQSEDGRSQEDGYYGRIESAEDVIRDALQKLDNKDEYKSVWADKIAEALKRRGFLKGEKAMKFRKKPVVIEATQWYKSGDHPHGVVRHYRTPGDGQGKCQHCGNVMRNHGWLDTLEGGHIVCPGDWIITGVKGEHYPCKPDIFKATYDPVD